MTNDYYVYLYWRLDTNEPFYVGKGKGDRWRFIYQRNKHFENIINKHDVIVEIIKNNLTENEAFYWEEKIIETLVFEYGFSIDIKNNHSKEKGHHLVNQTWGGEGGSYPCKEETKRKISLAKKGRTSPMKGKHLSEKAKKLISDKAKERFKIKENNPMYGKRGENCPNYGRNPWMSMTEETKENAKRKIGESRKGEKNWKSKWVICLTTKRIFGSTREAERYYNISHGSLAKCCKRKNGYKSAGKLNDGTKLVWRYLTWKHNKKYRIINEWR